MRLGIGGMGIWSCAAMLAAAACSKTDSAAIGKPTDASVGDGSMGLDAASADGGTGAPDGAAPLDAAGGDGSSPDAGLGVWPNSVTQFHKNDSRDGVYVDAAITKAAAKNLHRDTAFTTPQLSGPIYAQPLYVEDGVGHKDTLYVASEQNIVYAIDAMSGALLWQKSFGKPVPVTKNPCHYIDPTGITGTPVIDPATRTMFFDALMTPDDGTTKRQQIWAISIDDGSTRPGWPVLPDATAKYGNFSFDSNVQNQRPALTLFQGRVYATYAAYAEDCPANWHGWMIGVAENDPTDVRAWTTSAPGGGIWGPGGSPHDESAIYAVTGNQDQSGAWYQGESIMRFGPGPVWSGTDQDRFTPSNWVTLDEQDLDIGSVQPVLFDMPGAPSPKLAAAFGKFGDIYVVDRTNLGGLGKGNGVTGEGLVSANVASNYIITAPAFYTTGAGTFAAIAAPGTGCPMGSTHVVLKIAANPWAITRAWCANAGDGDGSPIVTTTDGRSEAIVWALGAEGDTKIHGFDAETGAPIYDGGPDTFMQVARFQTPIVSKGRFYWVSNQEVIAFTVK